MTQDWIHQPNDKLFKLAMTDHRVALEFFSNYLPETILRRIDLATLVLCNTEFISNDYQKFTADVIYSAKFINSEQLLYLLCEQQSEIDEDIALRIVEYTLHTMRYYRDQNHSKLLPVVYPVIYYVGEAIHNIPFNVFERFGAHADLARDVLFQPCFVDACRISDKELRRQFWTGLLGYVMKYRKKTKSSRFWARALRWIERVKQADGLNYARNVLRYSVDSLEANEKKQFMAQIGQKLSSSMRGDVMTLADIFKQEGYEVGRIEGRKRGLKEGRQEGRQEGRREGRQEGVTLVAKNLYAMNLTKQQILDATGIDIEEVLAE